MPKFIKFIFGFLFFILLSSCSDSEFTSNSCVGKKCDPGVSAKQFDWEIGIWSRCSRTCGGGTKTRSVKCSNNAEVDVPDDECSGVKPNVEESCNTQACVADYDWNTGPWGGCSRVCGGGTMYRSVTCQSKEGVYVAESYCPQQKPEVSKLCNQHSCPVDQYSWVPDAWSTCTKTCGGGSRTRSVTCRNAQNIIVDGSYCSGTQPPEEEACNTQSCSYSYTWSTGAWSSCSKTCGGGTQTRSLGCKRDDGVFVQHTLCANPAPATERACNTQTCPVTCNKKTINETVTVDQNKVDVLLVVDDSGSMEKDNAKLANKLSGFVTRLENSNIDWQMCVTTTSTDYFRGRPIQWQGSTNGSHILKKTSGNLHSIFRKTMTWIGAGFEDDERGILAMNLSLKDNGRSHCYRNKAALAVIVISDEDERSVGGNANLSSYDYKPLGALDWPSSFLTTVKEVFPAGKRVVVNSIIVKDKQCLDQQRAEASNARGYYGTKYRRLSNLTGGGVESICAADYSLSLQRFHSCIIKKLGSLKLQCVPTKTPNVKVNGANYNAYISVSGDKIYFNPAVEGPATITGSYCCP